MKECTIRIYDGTSGPTKLEDWKTFCIDSYQYTPGVRYALQFSGFHRLLYFVYCRKVRRHNTLLFQGKTYRYFDTDRTWYNERAVEIPIVMEMVRKYEGTDILEIGNVRSNYFNFDHDIVDKYEFQKA